MAKGQTNSPLQIKVAEQWTQHPAVVKLAAAGHQIIPIAGDDCDLILHPSAHNWTEPMFVEEEKKDGTKFTPYLDVAIKAARARKRAKK